MPGCALFAYRRPAALALERFCAPLSTPRLFAMLLPSWTGVCNSQNDTREAPMRDPHTPDTRPDEYLPDASYAHQSRSDAADEAGINPRDPSSMPRGEDDAKTFEDSPEFHDRTDVPGSGTKDASSNSRSRRT